MSDTREQVLRLLEPVLASLGLTLWELEFRKEGPQWLLRIYIDREPGGVTLDDCETVSRDLGAVLDVEDVLRHAYTLEVSSPGLDRTLTRSDHYRKCIGRTVRVKTHQAIDGQKVFRGTLSAFDGQVVELARDQGGPLRIPLEQIAKASLEVVL